MPLARMTTRRWMVAVAVVGLLMGGAIGIVRLKRRSDDFTVRSQNHARQASLYNLYTPGVDEHLRATVEPEMRSVLENRKAYLLGAFAYHDAMTGKYLRAARYPWLPVEPDLPEPR
jgi:hypothetical protein